MLNYTAHGGAAAGTMAPTRFWCLFRRCHPPNLVLLSVSGTAMARYAMESSKQLANGLIKLGDMGYKTLFKYCHELLPDGSGSPISSNNGWKPGRLEEELHIQVIQDICFSRFSQWVAIVTSKCTSHIFVLSPFGGECSMQVQNYHDDGPILAPPPSFPWWFASSFAKNQYSFSLPPPALVTLSV